MKRLFLSMLALIFLPFSGAIAVAQSAGVNGDWEVTQAHLRGQISGQRPADYPHREY